MCQVTSFHHLCDGSHTKHETAICKRCPRVLGVYKSQHCAFLTRRHEDVDHDCYSCRKKLAETAGGPPAIREELHDGHPARMRRLAEQTTCQALDAGNKSIRQDNGPVTKTAEQSQVGVGAGTKKDGTVSPIAIASQAALAPARQSVIKTESVTPSHPKRYMERDRDDRSRTRNSFTNGTHSTHSNATGLANTMLSVSVPTMPGGKPLKPFPFPMRTLRRKPSMSILGVEYKRAGTASPSSASANFSNATTAAPSAAGRSRAAPQNDELFMGDMSIKPAVDTASILIAPGSTSRSFPKPILERGRVAAETMSMYVIEQQPVSRNDELFLGDISGRLAGNRHSIFIASGTTARSYPDSLPKHREAAAKPVTKYVTEELTEPLAYQTIVAAKQPSNSVPNWLGNRLNKGPPPRPVRGPDELFLPTCHDRPAPATNSSNWWEMPSIPHPPPLGAQQRPTTTTTTPSFGADISNFDHRVRLPRWCEKWDPLNMVPDPLSHVPYSLDNRILHAFLEEAATARTGRERAARERVATWETARLQSRSEPSKEPSKEPPKEHPFDQYPEL